MAFGGRSLVEDLSCDSGAEGLAGRGLEVLVVLSSRRVGTKIHSPGYVLGTPVER